MNDGAGRPRRSSFIVSTRFRRRGNALIEFVLCLPFLFFILGLIFTIGTGLLRKQRTIEAARYAGHATLRGIGDPDEFHWMDDGPQYPDPPEEFPAFSWRGQVHPIKVWEEYFAYLPQEWVAVQPAHGSHNLDDLRAGLDRMDTDDAVHVTEVVQSFWEDDDTGEAVRRQDWQGNWHDVEPSEFDGTWHPMGVRVWTQYKPRLMPWLSGPFSGRYVQDNGHGHAWAWRHPDMWDQLFWTRNLRFFELQEDLEMLDEVIHQFSAATDRTAFERWRRH